MSGLLLEVNRRSSLRLRTRPPFFGVYVRTRIRTYVRTRGGFFFFLHVKIYSRRDTRVHKSYGVQKLWREKANMLRYDNVTS